MFLNVQSKYIVLLHWGCEMILGFDSSLLRLPDSAELREEFGVVQCGNQPGTQDSYPEGRVSVLYDLLNQIALDAHLVASRQGERELAHAHLPHVTATDLLIT